MNSISVPPQLVNLAVTLHKLSILLFGYLIPALSSVKTVVRKDSEAYHQWTTYWLILHLYITILSPLLHIALHPIFQIIAILWLSLPQYRGASLVYERIVVPWVDQYESKVDEALDEAHRSVRRWVWRRFGSVIWLIIGEGGSLAEGLLDVVMGFIGGDAVQSPKSGEDVTLQPSISTESLLPRHSIKEALSHSSSFSEVDDVSNSSFDPTNDFVRDFVSMLRSGLHVFANVTATDESTDSDEDTHVQRNLRDFEGGLKLGIFSYTEDGRGAFLISLVAAGANETDTTGSSQAVLPLDIMKPFRPTGAHGLIFECQSILPNSNNERVANNIKAEIVLSDESDRNILLNGLNACLPYLISSKKNE